jgi:hypothetical protein
MLIPALIAMFGAFAATTIVIAIRLVPPIREPETPSESEAISVEARREMEDQIEPLRTMMLQQRLEIARLRREIKIQRRVQDPRGQELEARKRRAGIEARERDRQPLGSVERIASS